MIILFIILTVHMKDYKQQALDKHQTYKGKIATHIKVPMETQDDLATYYSPGVAAPCLAIQEDPEQAYTYTSKHNTVAVISDGSAVLGLGNIGGLASLPVMEGKAALFKKFGGVDAVPIVLDTQDPDEIISIVQAIAPTYGGINLEDIKAPQCFYIEEQLKKKLNIPVFHDDQHGTAIVTLAGLINSLKLVNKTIQECKIVMSGAGAAGIAIAKLLAAYGATHIVICDSRGAIYTGREHLNPYKEEIAVYNTQAEQGSLSDVIQDADIFIGISMPDLLSTNDIGRMREDAIVFAMANPVPEITPEQAQQGGAAIVATGRSDYPNQVNNILAFPGLFRGILDSRQTTITQAHLIAAAEAIAHSVTQPTPEKIVPSPLDPDVAQIVADAVSKTQQTP